jgi:phosphinothricin acetyltransferase
MIQIRLARPSDAGAIRAIYAPFCALDSHVSFETEPPSLEEMRRRVQKTLERWPWLVGDDGEVVGYVYACEHRERAAYRWSVDVTVYIRGDQRRTGLGRALYTSLFELLRLHGYVNAYAGTSLPNEGSIGLHRALGFQPVGVYTSVGHKGGAWHDVAWWQLALVDRPENPREPISFSDLEYSTTLVARAIDAGQEVIRSHLK